MAVRVLRQQAAPRQSACLELRTAARLGRLAAPYVLAAALALLTVGLWAYLIAQVADAANGDTADRREDVVAYYAAGRLLQVGRGAALYDPDEVAETERSILGRPAGHHDGLAYMNPPFVAGLFRLLAELPYNWAQAVWFTLSVLGLFASLALLWPELRTLPRRWAAVFVLAALASFPVVWSLLYGQVSSFILLFWVLFYRGLKSGREMPAGVALAGVLIKPQLALVPAVYLVATRRWGALAVFAAAAAALVGASALLAGPEATFVAYPRFLLESFGWQQEYGVDRAHMFGWSSFLPLLLPGASRAHVLLAAGTASAVTLGLALIVWRRGGEAHDTSQPMLALAAATILTSPHIHAQDLGILILPAALLVAHRRDVLAAAVLGALFLLVPMVVISVNLATPMLALALAFVAGRSLELRFEADQRRRLARGSPLRRVGLAPSTRTDRRSRLLVATRFRARP